ncbi:cytochrome P450 [Dacryopinax primogenitus]|uniref:Cytochrome P450 n=1 Tax=Dacryopinax primogenitus (strain DJM 731) TaxID=1858805 RepID=M5FRK0_DACPD|nr:cytochrome P450 [Dacryopinax primogenitus]EJT99780.1 cytochrome P450 [Dacryopinax primogenitus]
MAIQWSIILSAIVVLFLIALLSRSRRSSAPVLTSDWFFGYLTLFRMLTQYNDLLVEGYAKFNKHAFQLPGIRGWIVFVGRELYDDLRKAKDDTLSFSEEITDTISMEYTIGRAYATDLWHNAVIRKQMTQALGPKFPEVYDETVCAFEDELRLSRTEWNSVHAHGLILSVICRASNRLFVGLPLCRDPVYTQISRDFSGTVIAAGVTISLFPKLLKPLVGRWVTAAPRARRRFEKFLVPMIEERRRKEQEMGELWEKEKPSDLLQWLLDASKEHNPTAEDITTRILGINFGAMHTTALGFLHVLYWLAAHPEYAPVLREDVDHALANYGWTKEALGKMHKLDSFIKECMRFTGLTVTAMGRKAVKDVILSDGTFVPKGAKVVMNAWSIQHDPAVFYKPLEFDPWRYSSRIARGESEALNSLATASGEFFLWGGGAHVCPGRYFASQEMKTMLLVIVSRYDVKFEGLPKRVRPKDTWTSFSCLPDLKQRVMFKRRE